MGTENSNYSHDDQAGGEVQGTLCASSLFWSWWGGHERGMGTLYSIRASKERQVQWRCSLLRAPQQQVSCKHIPVGQKGGKTSCHCAAC